MATGLLADRPLPQLLAFALDRQLSGTFELADDPRQYALIVVSEGQILRVWTSEPVSYLGHVLYEGGLLNDAQLGASLAEVAATKVLHGQLLLDQGLIDVAQLTHALEQQRVRKLQHVFSFPPTSRFSFYGDVDLVGPRPNDATAADPLPIIWRGIATQPPQDHVRAAVMALGDRGIMLTGRFDTRSFREDERAAVDSLRHWPATVPMLATRRGVDEHAAEMLVYFLLVTKMGEVADPIPMPPSTEAPQSRRAGFPAQGDYVRRISVSTRPGGPDSAPASVRPGAPPSVRPVAVPQSVRPEAPPPSVRPAPPPSVRPVAPPPSHRDLAPPASVRPGQGWSGGVQSVGQAHAAAPPPQVHEAAPPVAAPLPRAVSVRPPEEPVKNEEVEKAMADAEMNFMLGERKQALELVKVALDISPKWPPAMVLMYALEASIVKKGQEDRLRDILKRLDSVLARNPTCRRGRTYRGKIRNRVGDLIGAQDDLTEAIALDPEDADAARELRIVERKMEAGDKGGSKPMSFLDRLRGK